MSSLDFQFPVGPEGVDALPVRRDTMGMKPHALFWCSFATLLLHLPSTGAYVTFKLPRRLQLDHHSQLTDHAYRRSPAVSQHNGGESGELERSSEPVVNGKRILDGLQKLGNWKDEVLSTPDKYAHDDATMDATPPSLHEETTPPVPLVAPYDPTYEARQLQRQAASLRLEAERMSMQVCLKKIARLEERKVQALAKGHSVQQLDLQLQCLRKDLESQSLEQRGNTKEENIGSAAGPLHRSMPGLAVASPNPMTGNMLLDLGSYLRAGILNETMSAIQGSEEIAGSLAKMLEMDLKGGSTLNLTQLDERLEMVWNGDFSFSGRETPNLLESELQSMAGKIKAKEVEFPKEWYDAAKGDLNQLASRILEYEYYTQSSLSQGEAIGNISKNETWMHQSFHGSSKGDFLGSVEAMFTYRPAGGHRASPTLQQIKKLEASVLPAARYFTTSAPEKVEGGYILRGNHRHEDGNALIAALDKALEKTPLKQELTVLYFPDFLSIERHIADNADFSVVAATNPCLYVTSAYIAQDQNSMAFLLTSTLGLATTIYLSFSFLLQDPEMLRLSTGGFSDANTAHRVFTDQSTTFLLTFLGIQLVHELSHRIVARVYNMKTLGPTILPSPVAGVTTTDTIIQHPVMNLEEQFDYSLAGPLAGMIVSVLVLALGAWLTVSGDPAEMLDIPLQLMKQSTLATEIIHHGTHQSLHVTGGQSLSGLTVSLHPVAAAALFGLLVNALAMLPLASTDGGIVALTLFGRVAKFTIDNWIAIGLIILGVLGSDLIGYYTSIVLVLQSEEQCLPTRNEVDSVSFPRVVAATVAYCMALLSLVPSQ